MTSGTDQSEAPETFQAFANRIKKSRPYISKKVGDGTIHGEALTDDRLIRPAIALAQLADAADPGRRRTGGQNQPDAATATYARERTALVSAQRQRQEMDNQVRRGELIERRAVAAVIPPAARRFRDTILQQVRDRVASDTERAALLADIATATESFISEAIPDGGADPS
jgi:hypothetical protein